MSIEAITWALNDAPDVPPPLVSTLVGLANHAGPDGRNSYPKLATLARYTRKTERSVMRDIEALKKLGLVRDGDRRIVDHLPAGQRPGVYDLAMDRRRDSGRPEKTGVRRGGKKKRTPDVDVTPTPDVDVTPTPDVDVRSETAPTPDVDVRSTPDVDVAGPLTWTSPPLIRNEPSVEPSISEPSREGRADAPPAPTANTPTAKPKTSKPRRGTRLPADWRPDQTLADWTLAQGLTRAEARRELEKFRDHWAAVPGAKGVKCDWGATWRNWVRREIDGRQPNGRRHGRPMSQAEHGEAVLNAWRTRLNPTPEPPLWQAPIWPAPVPNDPKVIDGATTERRPA